MKTTPTITQSAPLQPSGSQEHFLGHATGSGYSALRRLPQSVQRFTPLAVALLVACCGRPAQAERVWTGGVSGNWATAANWDNGASLIVPQPGADLVFPVGVSRRNTTNNFPAGRVFRSITFQEGGYSVSGNGIVMTGFVASASSSSLNVVKLAIELVGEVPATASSGTLDLAGALSGTGGVTKQGAGILIFSGNAANTYAGPTRVAGGTLRLQKSIATGAVRGTSLTIGNAVKGSRTEVVEFAASSQASTAVDITVNETGLLDLNGFTDDLGDITLNAGRIETGLGRLDLRGTLTASGAFHLGSGFPPVNQIVPSSITGLIGLGSSSRTFNVLDNVNFGSSSAELDVSAAITGSAGVIKTGGGTLRLSGLSDFTGAVTVNQGKLVGVSAVAFGASSGGVAVNNSATLELAGGVNVAGETLTLNSSATAPGALRGGSGVNYWSGGVQLARGAAIEVVSGAALILSGVVSGGFGFDKAGTGQLSLSGSGANTFTGTTTVREGVVKLEKAATASNGANPGLLVIGTSSGTADTASVVIGGSLFEQIANTAKVQIEASGKLRITEVYEFIGLLAGSGHIELLNGATLRTKNAFEDSTFSGRITGSDEPGFLSHLRKEGPRALTLSGNSGNYPGEIVVMDGTLQADGSLTGGDMRVLGGAVLRGNGSVGPLSASAQSVVIPGTESAPGRLTASRAEFQNGSRLAVRLKGPGAGTSYDQLRVNGLAIVSSGSVLDLTLGYMPSRGTVFKILELEPPQNAGVTGQFSGFPNHFEFSTGAVRFRIDYDGGDGNDVTLTVLAAPLGFTAAQLTASADGRIDPNDCNDLSVALSNDGPDPIQGITAHLVSDTLGATVTQPDSAYPNVPPGSQAMNITPFQLSTASGLRCGSLLRLRLMVNSTSHGSFEVPVTLQVGSPSATAMELVSAAQVPFADGASALMVVPGTFPALVAKVAVGLYFDPPVNGELSLELVSSSGVVVPLYDGPPQTRHLLGTGCDQGSLVWFTADAQNLYQPGTQPASGTYRPIGRLEDLRGGFGPGGWHLRMRGADANGGAMLRCWKLVLTPAECGPGDGQCAQCAESFAITGNLLDTAINTTRLAPAYSTTNSQAGCNGTATQFTCDPTRPVPYDAYLFENSGADALVRVGVNGPCGYFSGAVLDPGNASLDGCPALLGGVMCFDTSAYTFPVPANHRFLVFIERTSPELACGDYNGMYQLTVGGGQCLSQLQIMQGPGAQHRIVYSTAFPGRRLQYTADVAHGPWLDMTNALVIRNSSYTMTNTSVGSQRFYRLCKP